MPLPTCLYRYQDELQVQLRGAIGTGSSPLYAMLRYHLGWVDQEGRDQRSPGKMSRPILCLLACEAVQGDWHAALPAAAAVELLHNFSLIHDDIQDRSWERRNRPTVWKVWGEAQGINAGDAMYALAQLVLTRLEETGTAGDKVALLSRELNLTSVQLCEGQYLDIEYENHIDVNAAQYLDMIDKKTARLFETSLRFGALMGTDDQEQVSALSTFGRNLGMAFQVHNDLQGIWGEEERGKKSPYTDIRNKKKTLPIIYALQRADDQERERLVDIYGKGRVSARDARLVLRVLEGIGARRYAARVRQRYHLRALKALDKAGVPSASQGELAEMAAYLLGK